MKDRLKIGNRISCVIEQAETNFITVTFRTAGNEYRGVLINENNSTVRRVIPHGYYPAKAILDKETTESFCEEVANRALEKKSTKTRSKTSKQSCIVLDDYDLSHLQESVTTSIGKSPIDSIRGLVESIDTTSKVISLPHVPGSITVSSPTKTNTVNKSNNLKICTSSTLSSNNNHGKTEGKFSFTTTSPPEVLRSPVKTLNRHNSAKFELPDDSRDSKKETAAIGTASITDLPKRKSSSQKISSKRRKMEKPIKVDTDIIENCVTSFSRKKDKADILSKSKEQKNIKSATVSSSPKITRRNNELNFSISKKTEEQESDNQVRKKRRRKKPLIITKRKRIMDNKVENVTEPKHDTSSIGIRKQRSQLSKPKRVDPILIALKNIKKYDSLRKKRNLHNAMMNSGKLKEASNRQHRNARRNNLKKRLHTSSVSEIETSKKESESKSTSSISTPNESTVSSTAKSEDVDKGNLDMKSNQVNVPLEIKTQKQKKISSSKTDLDYLCEKLFEAKKQTERTDSEGIVNLVDAKKESAMLCSEKKSDMNNSTNQVMNIVKEDKKISSQITNANLCINQTISVNVSSTTTPNNSIIATIKSEKRSPEIDLLCHEESFVKKECEKIIAVEIKPRKIRRKPIQVFKSLPNPAEERKKQEEEEEEANRKRQEENEKKIISQQQHEPIKKQKVIVAKGHNTRYRGTKSVIPKLNLSPKKVRKVKVDPKSFKTSSVRMTLWKKQEVISSEETSSELSNSQSHSKQLSSPLSDTTDCTRDSLDTDDDNDDDEDDEDDEEEEKCERKSMPVRKKKKSQLIETFELLKPMKRSSNDIRVDDIIWGKCHGHGWWPGRVMSLVRNSETKAFDEREAHIGWLNSKTQNVMQFKDLNLFVPVFRKRFNNNKKGMYAKAVMDALLLCKDKYGSL